jgi:hypothetical protein
MVFVPCAAVETVLVVVSMLVLRIKVCGGLRSMPPRASALEEGCGRGGERGAGLAAYARCICFEITV